MIVAVSSSTDDGRDPDIVMYGMIAFKLEPGIVRTISQEQIAELNAALAYSLNQVVEKYGLMLSNPDMLLEYKMHVRETLGIAGSRLSEETQEYVDELIQGHLDLLLTGWGMKKLETEEDVTAWTNWAYEKDDWYKSYPAEMMQEAMRVEAAIGEDFTPSRVINTEESQHLDGEIFPQIELGCIPVKKEMA